MRFSMGERELPSPALDVSAIGGVRDDVASEGRSAATLSAWNRKQ